MARNGRSTGSSVRPTETVTVRKVTGGGGPGPSMDVPGSGNVRRVAQLKDRRGPDEFPRAEASAAKYADVMAPIGGPASDPKTRDDR